MRKLSVRLAKPEDAENYSTWLKADLPISHADPNAAIKTQAFTAVVDDEGQPVLMQTAQPVLMLEALAPKPGLSPSESARAIREMFQAMKRVARAYGFPEIYFASDHEPFKRMVEKKSHKKHGISKVDLQVYRVKI
jgi:hypothetical protein